MSDMSMMLCFGSDLSSCCRFLLRSIKGSIMRVVKRRR
jgi:hypothetical protein